MRSNARQGSCRCFRGDRTSRHLKGYTGVLTESQEIGTRSTSPCRRYPKLRLSVISADVKREACAWHSVCDLAVDLERASNIFELSPRVATEVPKRMPPIRKILGRLLILGGVSCRED